jgi:hypothetical protein
MKLWILAFLTLLSTSARAEIISLSEDDAVALAFEKNLEMQAYHLGKQARFSGIEEAEATFGRQLAVQLRHSDNRQPSISSLEGVSTTSTNEQTLGVSLSQKLMTGRLPPLCHRLRERHRKKLMRQLVVSASLSGSPLQWVIHFFVSDRATEDAFGQDPFGWKWLY